jgi:hypothetical protein
MKLLPSDEWYEDLGPSIFVCFDRDEDGTIQGAAPEVYYGHGYMEDNFDFDKWTHFIDGNFNFIFEDADPINFPSERKGY